MADPKQKKPAKNVPLQGSQLIATADNDITIAFWNDILPLQDPTVDAKAPGRGLALYDEVMRDGRCRSALAKRKSKLKRRDWTVEAASEEPQDEKAAELARSVLASIGFDSLCDALMEAVLKGFAIAELLWGRNRDGFIVPIGFRDHDQRRFVFDTAWRPRLLTRTEIMRGIELPQRKFITHRFGAKANNPYGLGLGATLYWHVLFKREGVAFWLVFLEKFASPTVVGKYPVGTPQPEQEKLRQTLQSMVAQGSLVVPIGTDVALLEAARTGALNYEEWCRYWDEQTAEVVNGETLSTNIRGEGSRAAAETHAEEGDGIVDSDCDDLSATLNETLMRWVTELNFPDANPPTVWRRRPKNVAAEEEQRAAREKRHQERLKTLRLLKSFGYQLTDECARLEEDFEAPLTIVAASPEPTPVDPDKPGAEFADSEDPIAHLLADLIDEGDPAFADFLGDIETAFREARGYADLPARLLMLAGTGEHAVFAERLGNAMALAEFEGMAQALDETGVYASFKRPGSKKND